MREDVKAKIDELTEQKEELVKNDAEKMLAEWFIKKHKNKAMHDKKKHYYEANRGEACEGRETGRQN